VSDRPIVFGGVASEGWPLDSSIVGEDVEPGEMHSSTIVHVTHCLERDRDFSLRAAQAIGEFQVPDPAYYGTGRKERSMFSFEPMSWESYKARKLAPEAHYATPAQVAQRLLLVPQLCWRLDCTLSGGHYHVGPCEPCKCGLEHAVDECPHAYSR
jgi:hypothetical protein